MLTQAQVQAQAQAQSRINAKVTQLFSTQPNLDTQYAETYKLTLDPFLDECEHVQLLIDNLELQSFPNAVKDCQDFILKGPMHKRIFIELILHAIYVNTKRRPIIKKLKEAVIPEPIDMSIQRNIFGPFKIPPLSMINPKTFTGDTRVLWMCIIFDKLADLQTLINRQNYFDFTKLRTFKNTKNVKVSYLDAAAYFGSVQVFRYFLMNGSPMTPFTAVCSIIGGNSEIIQIIEQTSPTDPFCNEKCINAAIISHHHTLMYWLMAKYPYYRKTSSIAGLNFHAFKKMLYDKQELNLKEAETAVIMHNTAVFHFMSYTFQQDIVTQSLLNQIIYRGSSYNIDDLMNHCNMYNTIASESHQYLRDCVFFGNIEGVQCLMKHGFDITFKDSSGQNLLFSCVHRELDKMFKFLLDQGLNINEQDNDGNTVLHLAIILLYPAKTVQKLYDLGSDPNIQNKEGKTVLDLIQSYTDMPDIPEIGRIFGLEVEYVPQNSESEDLTDSN